MRKQEKNNKRVINHKMLVTSRLAQKIEDQKIKERKLNDKSLSYINRLELVYDSKPFIRNMSIIIIFLIPVILTIFAYWVVDVVSVYMNTNLKIVLLEFKDLWVIISHGGKVPCLGDNCPQKFLINLQAINERMIVVVGDIFYYDSFCKLCVKLMKIIKITFIFTNILSLCLIIRYYLKKRKQAKLFKALNELYSKEQE